MFRRGAGRRGRLAKNDFVFRSPRRRAHGQGPFRRVQRPVFGGSGPPRAPGLLGRDEGGPGRRLGRGARAGPNDRCRTRWEKSDLDRGRARKGLARRGAGVNVKALVLRSPGSNCDVESAWALEAAGATPERVHVNAFLRGEARLRDYGLLMFPGGFSFGDDIASGKVLANRLVFRLREQLEEFLRLGRPVIGVCNGFQVLVKAGLLPDPLAADALGRPTVTLSDNDSGRFECRWIYLKTASNKSFWTRGLPDVFPLPVAHGEGNFMTATPGGCDTRPPGGRAARV
ncbi:MAG: hypothetical protein E6Q99_05620, partial [Elusimicrobia bacterium]